MYKSGRFTTKRPDFFIFVKFYFFRFLSFFLSELAVLTQKIAMNRKTPPKT